MEGNKAKPRKVAGGVITGIGVVGYPMNGKPFPTRKGIQRKEDDPDMDNKKLEAILKGVNTLIESVSKNTDPTPEGDQDTQTNATQEPAQSEGVLKELTDEDRDMINAMIDEKLAPVQEQLSNLQTSIDELKAGTQANAEKTEEAQKSIQQTAGYVGQISEMLKGLSSNVAEGNSDDEAEEEDDSSNGSHIMKGTGIERVLNRYRK